MKKILLTFVSVLLLTQCALAKDDLKLLDKSIRKFDIPKDSVSISVKNIETGEIVKEINAKVPTSPASTQKMLTYFPSLKVLGENYNFSTKLYRTKNGDFYIKLGGDPYLTTKDLKALVSNIKLGKWGEIKNLYIDDTILDNKCWGEGWQWDDDLNTLMPKFGAYNLDKNLYTVIINPTTIDSPADIFTAVFYPTTFINQTKTATSTNISLSRDNYISPDSITVNGTVATKTKIQVPVNYLRRYFLLRLDDSFRSAKLEYYGKYPRAKVPNGAVLIAEIKHPISMATEDVLKNSNNLVAETVFKLAGGKYTKSTGTEASAMAMFNNYCSTNKIDCSKIRITDASGVSKNNLVTSDFMTDYIIATSKIYGLDKVKTLLATAGEGTLKGRMFYLNKKLWAKTGTLSNISGIAGIISAKSGNNFAFSIYINDGKSTDNTKKLLEDVLIKEIYNNL
ncbi:MAG: D-alanyl-D-alanine carboxypeptidase/D-alanyl-D-alanine-endopeptidase [Candidatus Gastranaerophilaceae bacterium]